MSDREDKDLFDQESESFQWRNRWHHILFFLAYIMNYSVESAILLVSVEGIKSEKSFLFVIVAMFMGGSIIFLQNSIGQYTRNTCLFIGEMFPFFHGLGYTMLLLGFFEFVIQAFYSAKLVYYTIVTICNPSPAWMKCYDLFYKIFPNCFSRADIERCPEQKSEDNPCFDMGKSVLSAKIFKELLVFGRIRLDKEITENFFISDTLLILAFCFFNSLVVYIFLLVGTRKSIRSLYTPLRTGILLCLGLLLAIGVVLFIQPGIQLGLTEMWGHFISINPFSVNSWTTSAVVVVESLRLAEGGHILFGSYMPREKPDFWRAVFLINAFVCLVLAATLYYHLFLGLLLHKLNRDIEEVITETQENTVFVLFPTFLGILPSASFFALVFFFVLFLLNFFSMLVKVIVIEKSITEYFHLTEYYVYLRYTLCTLAILIGYSFEKNEVASRVQSLDDLHSVFCLSVVFVQEIMAIVYGLQNVMDDIEFMMRVKPLYIIKLFWIVSTFVTAIALISSAKKIDLKEYTIFKILFLCLFISPIIIGFIAKFFEMAKAKNLIGLLRPTDRYGPPELEERILRVLYNPRLTLKYKRREEVCQHECLLHTSAIRTAVVEEILQMQRFSTELKFKEEEKHIDHKVTQQFIKHQKFVEKALIQQEGGEEIKTDENLNEDED